MRAILRFIFVIVIVVGVGALALGWWAGSSLTRDASDRPVGTSGTTTSETERARQIGAEAGERVAVAGERAQAALGSAAILSRVKAKMALDELVKASAIDVDVSGSTVTLSGRVASKEESDRAERLATETDGVTRVMNRLEIRR